MGSIREPDGSWRSSGPINVRLDDGTWKTYYLDGRSGQPLNVRYPDGTWKPIAWTSNGHWSDWMPSDPMYFYPDMTMTRAAVDFDHAGLYTLVRSDLYQANSTVRYGDMFDPAAVLQTWQQTVAAVSPVTYGLGAGATDPSASWSWHYDAPDGVTGPSNNEYTWDGYGGAITAYTETTYDFSYAVTNSILYPAQTGTYEYASTPPTIEYWQDDIDLRGLTTLDILSAGTTGVFSSPLLFDDNFEVTGTFSASIGDVSFPEITLTGTGQSNWYSAPPGSVYTGPTLSWPGVTAVQDSTGGTHFSVPLDITNYLNTHGYKVTVRVETPQYTTPWSVPDGFLRGYGTSRVGSHLRLGLNGRLRIVPPPWRRWFRG